MVTFTSFLFIYVFGGLTFLPLTIGLILLHAHLTFPTRGPEEVEDESQKQDQRQRRPTDPLTDLNTDLSRLPDELKLRTHEPDVAAGYFAVCREYVPGGVNGKPPERTTPAGSAVAAESPSVYQSMYRSIFDRNKSQTPVIDSSGKGGSNGSGTSSSMKSGRKVRNVFYVVLRHGHLMLYDDSEQLEVRHVISLTYHDVDIYAGGEKIPEGELWIKRNCIRLTRRRTFGDMESKPKPFFLFSENCSEKEDFYLAMIASQEKKPGFPESPPTPLLFETPHIIKLVQQLHASEENMQTRWINALIGRVFLAMYKTPDVKALLRQKITKKISRVPKPAFITSIKLRKIDAGDAAPFITNPKLKELTVDGDLTVEADVHYKGNFKLEIAAIARIELGSRIKAREVDLILAGVLKKLEGHILIRVKPPPSNRIWVSFEKPPRMEMSIEPIVSSRQITYSIILRAIESRIREVVTETLVYPNWDDVPFHDSMLQRFRGGIWEDDIKIKPLPDRQTEFAEQGLVGLVDKEEDSDEAEVVKAISDSLKEKSMSMPNLFDTAPTGLKSRKSVKSTISLDASEVLSESAVSSGAQTPATQKSVDRASVVPRSMRTTSFSSAASPIVSLDPATVESLQSHAKKGKSLQDAESMVKDINARSPPTSPMESPMGSPPQARSLTDQASKRSSVVSTSPSHVSKEQIDTQSDGAPSIQISTPPARTLTQSSTASIEAIAATPQSNTQKTLKPKHAPSLSASSIRSLTASAAEKRPIINQSISSATAAAKKWFANRNAGSNPATPSPSDETFAFRESSPKSAGLSDLFSDAPPSPAQLGTPSRPIGRGQPLPPPGTPLPGPPRENRYWATAPFASLTKRKAVAGPVSPALPKRLGPPNSVEHTPPTTAASAAAPPSSAPTSRPSSTSSTPPPSLPPHAANTTNDNDLNSEASIKAPASTSIVHRRPVPAPPLPARRKRSSTSRNNVPHDATVSESGQGDGMLVVEAPVADHSAPNSPMGRAPASEDESEESDKRARENGDKELSNEQGSVDSDKGILEQRLGSSVGTVEEPTDHHEEEGLEQGRDNDSNGEIEVFQAMDMDSYSDVSIEQEAQSSDEEPVVPSPSLLTNGSPSEAVEEQMAPESSSERKAVIERSTDGGSTRDAMDEKNADKDSLKLLETGWDVR